MMKCSFYGIVRTVNVFIIQRKNMGFSCAFSHIRISINRLGFLYLGTQVTFQ